MTEEKKLAERYVNGIPMLAEEGEGFSRTQMQQAFIAGLKTKTQWHKVRENPNDLPKEDTKVLALMADKEIYIAHFYRKNVWDKVGTVIAWKEIVLPELPKESE